MHGRLNKVKVTVITDLEAPVGQYFIVSRSVTGSQPEGERLPFGRASVRVGPRGIGQMIDASHVQLTPDYALSDRAAKFKSRIHSEPRLLFLDQARLVTEAYRLHPGEPRIVQRAIAFAHSLRNIPITVDPDELIVGNRTPTPRAGVVFPEAAVNWIDREIESLPKRPQDPFETTAAQVREFREQILPFWLGRTLEDQVYSRLDAKVLAASRVVKINQRDHAQGHIIPNVRKWLANGPAGLRIEAARLSAQGPQEKQDFYRAVDIALAGAQDFIRRYGALAGGEVGRIARKLAESPAETFHEAVQSVWFLFVLLHAESNASSFSPGRLDQYLDPYLERDRRRGVITLAGALEILECFWLKCNEIVYMRNSESARYFAGFPTGFNIAIGGQRDDGSDSTNPLSWLCLKAQEHLLLPQPNLSVRLHRGSPQEFLLEVARVIGLGSGMPQVFNDESVIPALRGVGLSERDARDYAVVGCVELSTQGNNLGWSDAAMFNMVKVLELTLTGGVCLLSGERIGSDSGSLADYADFEHLEAAYQRQLDHFIDLAISGCDTVDRAHAELFPSPFLSSVIDDCVDRGVDVTAGGATYNLSGIQAIQIANVADSLAAIKQCVYDERSVSAARLLDALRSDFEGHEPLRQRLLNRVPKYGNDVEWVDRMGARWAEALARKLRSYRNARGGPYHAGFYTVSAHVPMGKNVGATPDGRKSGTPLADGGLSPMQGRDAHGPTAVLQSVSRIDANWGSNGTLLNMKFLPEFFERPADLEKFVALLRGLVRLKIHHAQFNVLRPEDLIRAQQTPELYRHLTVRVAGYTAYFTELAGDLQDEIIRRTTQGAS